MSESDDEARFLQPGSIARLLRALVPTSGAPQAEPASDEAPPPLPSAERAGCLLWDLSAMAEAATEIAAHGGVDLLRELLSDCLNRLEDTAPAYGTAGGTEAAGAESSCKLSIDVPPSSIAPPGRLAEICLGILANCALVPHLAASLAADSRMAATLVGRALWVADAAALCECCRLLTHAVVGGAGGLAPLAAEAATGGADPASGTPLRGLEQPPQEFASPGAATAPASQPALDSRGGAAAASANTKGEAADAPAGSSSALVAALCAQETLERVLWIADSTLNALLHERAVRLLAALAGLNGDGGTSSAGDAAPTESSGAGAAEGGSSAGNDGGRGDGGLGAGIAGNLLRLGAADLLEQQPAAAAAQLAAAAGAWERAARDTPSISGASAWCPGAASSVVDEREAYGEEPQLEFQEANIDALLRLLLALSERAEEARQRASAAASGTNSRWSVETAPDLCDWQPSEGTLAALAALLRHLDDGEVADLAIMLMCRHAAAFFARTLPDAALVANLLQRLRCAPEDNPDRIDGCWFLLAAAARQLPPGPQPAPKAGSAAVGTESGGTGEPSGSGGASEGSSTESIRQLLSAESHKCPLPESSSAYATVVRNALAAVQQKAPD